MTKAAVYLRVSGNEQNTENQLPALEKFAESRGFEITAIYREQESAWKSGHQSELKRFLQDCGKGIRKFDILLVWSLDRLSREGPAAILQLIHTMDLFGVRVISINEPWTEFPNEVTPLFYAIVGWVAEFESRRRSERTLAGLDRARKEGKTLGRPKGSQDKKPRHRAGYLQRWAGK